MKKEGKTEVKIDLSKYKKEDFIKMTWQDYSKIIEALYQKVNDYVKKNNVKIDAVVPILRGAMVAGQYLTFRLNLLRIIPIQLKYFFEDGDLEKIKLKKLLEFPKNIKFDHNPTFLLVENNRCFGLTSKTAALHLKERFPKCKIVLACDTTDYAYKDADKEYYDAIICGAFTNDTKELDDKQCKKFGIINKIRMLPWENLEEEYNTTQARQFNYRDLSNFKKEIKRK